MRLLLGLLLVGACSSGGELVVVTLHGDRSLLTAINVLTTIEGRQSTQPEPFAPSVTDFGLQLPPGTRGMVEITVGAFEGACIVRFADTTLQADDRDRVDVVMTLQPLPTPICN